ncbi:hypothetical protein [Paenibacillus piri]|uniref:Thiazole-containing bacteriocin maturation protein n=1 Tax=Paenibacillus piri TaxID=2547395 RepID=A0A4R5KSM4_9BACL|nr:hypothetical protein [Paenibacillus piri]TDF98015.1 hypothetical protein E1757_10885 [Paenibacillus piri]
MSYQREGVLAVGSGPILISLTKAWYESGESKITVYVTNKQPTDAGEFKKLLEQALPGDPEASLDILVTTGDGKENWEAIVRSFSFILYVSQHGDLEELQKLQAACIAEKKPLLPAMGLRGLGIAGPLIHPDSDGRWESAWRRVHSSVFPNDRGTQALSEIAASVLSNLIVYEWNKVVSGKNEADCNNQCYILDPLTLEGSWHPFLPHPIVSGHEPVRTVTELELALETNQEPADTEAWFSYFSGLTSAVSGIFHKWEEDELNQLPLSQCLVQPADPLSEGPTQLLPVIVRGGLTHLEARWESGLAGLEAYIERMKPLLVSGLASYRPEDIRIGAGGSLAEAVGRGLIASLTEELSNRILHDELVVSRMEYTRIEDTHCRFYLNALSILEGEPLIAVGEPIFGLPAAWVRSGASWYGSVGLGLTHALRQSLQKALMKTEEALISSVNWNDHKPQKVSISACHPVWHASWLQSAVHSLKQHRKRLEIIDLRCESFLKEGPVGIFGVRLREEESP